MGNGSAEGGMRNAEGGNGDLFVRRLPQLNPLRSNSANYLTGQAQITQIIK